MEHGVASYIDKYLAEEIEGVKKTTRHATITAKLDGPYGYSVEGDSNGVQSVVRDFQRWQNDIKVQQLSVDKPGLPKFLTSVAGQQSLQSLERQHQVVIEPVGKYVQKGDVRSRSMSRVTLPGGVTVEVGRGDLTKFHVDAVVNAANRRLDHNRGLAKAIVQAGITNQSFNQSFEQSINQCLFSNPEHNREYSINRGILKKLSDDLYTSIAL
ncbi:hypothetical protein NP493_393g04003 [Ridgeia piscesae]|uniref:Macro domain-containing protein n=1 Tax=Ridgeia piscesae TaxID=27915 RepID=A0AAD9NUX2_RIDPI|nr:hypothetical protein NP493_393g04003 [Ridgeia piscesae]